MRERYRQRKSPIVAVLFVILLAVIGGAVYFYIDEKTVSTEISAIDFRQYTESSFEKGAQQNEAKGVPLTAEFTEELSDDVYKTPMGFSIVSHSEKWKGEKLVEIYNELLNNMHGDEIMYVGEVDVYPGKSGLDSNIAGTQSSKQEYYPVFFNLPALVPQSLRYAIDPNVSIISLYNMDKFKNAAQAARTIAHEYGHHFTRYYFLKDDESALKSEYYNLRNLSSVGHEVIYKNWDEYIKNYEWDIYEMAAEDYVQLMGSPNAREIKKYKDINEVLLERNNSYHPSVSDKTVNVFPQDNIYIPLADDTPGLKDYYLSFIGRESGQPALEHTDFNMKMDKHSKNGYTYYNITWTKTIEDPAALYTLVCYDSNGDLFWPVKTVSGSEEAKAVVGTDSIIRGSSLYYLSDKIPDKDRIFRIYLILPDGRMQASEPFYADF